MKKQLLLLAVFIYQMSGLYSQTLDKKFPSTDNAVNATLVSGDTVYIGGDFTYVFTPARGLARFSAGSVKPDVTYPQLGGSYAVQAAEPDGSGGLYLGGYFDSYNGVLLPNPTAVIHLLADGKLDLAFQRVNDNSGYTIYALKKKGTRLYIGGTFTTANITGRNYLAALDAATGVLLPWLPDVPDNYVNRIDANDSLLFIGGAFSTVGNIANNYFAALTSANGQLIKNFPRSDYNYTNSFKLDGSTLYVTGPFTSIQNDVQGLARVDTASGGLDLNFPFTDGSISAILNDGSGGYYIGGSFSKVGKENKNNLAHILSDGKVDTAFKATVNGPVYCMTASADTLYFGGVFTIVNAKTRNNAAAVSRTKGTLALWNPNANGNVYAIALSNSTVYLGGYFTKLGSPTRNYAGAVGINNVLSTTWIPNPDSYVYSLLPNNDGSAIYIGGSFGTIKTINRGYVAKLNTTNADPLSWAPQPNSTVDAMALNGNALYLGGSFNSINNSIPRSGLAAVDTGTGVVTSFQADANGAVSDIKINNGKLYVGGQFTNIQGVTRNYGARFSLATGALDNWLAGKKINSYIAAIGFGNGNIILGGQFTTMNATTRNYIAAIDLTQPNYPLTNWYPNVYWNSFNSLNAFIHNGHDLIFGGSLSYLENGKNVSNLISLDDSTGLITHSLAQYPTGTVRAMSFYNNTLAVGGDFTGFTKVSDSSVYNTNAYLSGYNWTTWQALPDNYNANNTVANIFTDPTGKLVASGSFSRMNNVNRNYLAAINITTGLPTDFNPSMDGRVACLAIKDTSLFAGGYFTSVNTQTTPVPRGYIAAVSTKTGKATAWFGNADNPVVSLAVKDSTLYAGGAFTIIKGVSRNYGAAFSTKGTGAINSWNPNTNNIIWTILPYNNTVFISGEFTTVNGNSQNYIAQVSNSSGTPNSWNPVPDGPVWTFVNFGNKFYAGGNFNNIGTSPRNGLAAFDTATKAITNFDANLNSSPYIQGIAGWGKTLFIDGYLLNSINGTPRQYIGAVDTVSRAATNFNPQPNSYAPYPPTLLVNKNKLFYRGYFTQLYNDPISPTYLAVFNLEPLNQASALNFSNLTPTSVKPSVTKGSGDGRIFIVRKGNSLPPAPADSACYTGNATFGSGSKIGDSNYVVYTGNLDSVTVSGLTPNTKYQFAVYEYNGSGPGADYLTTPSLTGSITTPCPVYNLKTSPADSVRVCPGTNALIVAPAGFATYSWSSGDTNDSIMKSPGTYTVTFTDSNGCQGTASIIVRAFTKPNLGKDTTYKICAGTVANITTLYNTTSYPTVVWSIPRPDSTGAGIDTLIVTNSSGCSDTAIVTVVIVPKPNLGKDTTVSICLGSFINIKKLYDTTGYTTKVWSTPKPDSAIAGTYTLIVGNSTGCKDTAIINVTNNPKPDLGKDTTYKICAGTTTNLNTLYTTTGFASAVWNTATPASAAPGTYTLIVTNSFGCKDTAIAIVGTNPKPNLGKDTTYKICIGSSANLTTLYNITGYASVTWTTQRPDSAVKGTYKLFVVTSFGCKDTAVITIDTIPGSVITATSTFTNAICFGSATGTIYVKPTNGKAPYQYKNGTTGAYQISNVFKALKAASYTIYIKDSGSCTGNTAPVVIGQLPQVTATFTKTDATCLNKPDGTITVTATGGKPPYKYKLGLNGIFQDPSTFTGLRAGPYMVYIRDNAGCTGSTAFININQPPTACLQKGEAAAAGNHETAASFNISLSPNPSNSAFTLLVHSDKATPIQLRVLDVNGKTLYTTKGQPEQAFRFGGEFVSGVYLVEVRQGDVVKTVKAVKVR